MKKLLSVVMIAIFTITTFAQTEFRKVYTEVHSIKTGGEVESLNIETIFTFNYKGEKNGKC